MSASGVPICHVICGFVLQGLDTCLDIEDCDVRCDKVAENNGVQGEGLWVGVGCGNDTSRSFMCEFQKVEMVAACASEIERLRAARAKSWEG